MYVSRYITFWIQGRKNGKCLPIDIETSLEFSKNEPLKHINF